MKNKQLYCDICGAKATRRIRVPFRLNMCKQCSKYLLSDLSKRGVEIVDYPGGMREAEKSALDCELLSQSASHLVTWIARTKQEYDRGIELGMIGGWSSWEDYEAYFDEFRHASNKPLALVDAGPDEIVAALTQHGLPNTPAGRSEVYQLMPATCEQTITFELHPTPEQEAMLNQMFEESGDGDLAVTALKTGRNDPCPCGSGRKFKKCCIRREINDE